MNRIAVRPIPRISSAFPSGSRFLRLRTRFAIALGIFLAALAYPACVSHAQNLVINGDFSLGNVGFTTDYILNGMSQTTYYMGYNPLDFNDEWASYGDHTSGNGMMMILDGATTPNKIAWSETLPVAPNQNYSYSFWLASSYFTNPAQLQVSINNQPLGSPIIASTTTGQWMESSLDWNSGASVSASISIVDLNLIASGNDFTLDDISFQTVTPAPDSLCIAVMGAIPGATLLFRRRRKRPATTRASA